LEERKDGERRRRGRRVSSSCPRKKKGLWRKERKRLIYLRDDEMEDG